MEHEVGVYGRRSIRLRGYDYTQVGAYFVTIAVRGRLALFGEVVDGEVRPNDAGEMVRKVWQAMPQRFPFVEVDAFVAMPDHVHGIIVIRGGGARAPDGARAPTRDAPTSGRADVDTRAPTRDAPTPSRAGVDTRAPTRDAPTPGRADVDATPNGWALGDVVGAYKSLTTRGYARGVHTAQWPPFHRRLWQRNFYERVIRDEYEMNEVRAYIRDNPSRWEPGGLM